MLPTMLPSGVTAGVNENLSRGGGSNMAAPVIAAGITAGAGLLQSLLGNSAKNKEAKERQAFVQQMLNNAPQFQFERNPLTGYSTSPMQDMLNYGFMNSLINDLAPMAGFNLGEGFSDIWNERYTPEQYAFQGWKNNAPPMGGVGSGGMNPMGGGGGGQPNPYEQAIAQMQAGQMQGQPRSGNAQYAGGGGMSGGNGQQPQMPQGRNPMFEALKGFLVR